MQVRRSRECCVYSVGRVAKTGKRRLASLYTDVVLVRRVMNQMFRWDSGMSLLWSASAMIPNSSHTSVASRIRLVVGTATMEVEVDALG